METGQVLQGNGELSRCCVLLNGRNELRLCEQDLPAFLLEAFKAVGQGRGEAAETLLTPENLCIVDEGLVQGRPGGLISKVVLGLVYQGLKRWPEARTCLVTAVDREANASVYNMLANICHQLGTVSEALAMRQRAWQLVPDDPVVEGALARDYLHAGHVAEGMKRLRRMIERGTISQENHSLYLLHLHYLPEISQSQLLKEHRAWAGMHAVSGWGRGPFLNTRDPRRRLRIGYLSADFHEHVGCRSLRGILPHRDSREFEIYGYSNAVNSDKVTAELSRSMDAFQAIRSLDDVQVARLIESDRIDILVALSGHTAGHRLGVLARRPAPVQVDWGGVNSTGMAQVDYRFTDPWLDPLGSDSGVVETLIRLPRGLLVYPPPQEANAPGESPFLSHGDITFGSACHDLKINPRVLGLWAQVLRACPGARLKIKCRAGEDSDLRGQWSTILREAGIEEGRVDIEGWWSKRHYLEFYRQIDIALDTYPFNGCLTSLEALWMGVPVVSLAGPLWVSRMGLSLLTQAGLQSFVAHTPEQFVAKAQALAAHTEALIQMRTGLRAHLKTRALLDCRALAQDMGAAYRDMWVRWCRDV